MLLQTGQLLSQLGTSSSTIAYPLLVLALTDSPAKAGVVGFARSVPWALFSLPAGLAADRWNRRWLMITADGVRVLAIGSLAATILLDRVAFWQIVVVAFVEGSGTALFNAARPGALRAVVPIHQLPAAAAVESGRGAAVRLAAPPLGGALFGIARALPFLVDAISYGCSTLSLLAMRTPFQEDREPHHASIRTRLAEGLRFVWGRPFLRTCALLFGLTNFIGPGVLFAVIVIGKEQGLSGGGVGAAGCCVRSLPAARVVRVTDRAPPASCSSRPAARALDVDRLCRLRVLAERLRARRLHPADGPRDPVDGLGRPWLPDRDDTRPVARPRGVRNQHNRIADRAARPTRSRHPARRRVGSRDHRCLCSGRASACALGNAEPVDSDCAEPGRASTALLTTSLRKEAGVRQARTLGIQEQVERGRYRRRCCHPSLTRGSGRPCPRRGKSSRSSRRSFVPVSGPFSVDPWR